MFYRIWSQEPICNNFPWYDSRLTVTHFLYTVMHQMSFYFILNYIISTFTISKSPMYYICGISHKSFYYNKLLNEIKSDQVIKILSSLSPITAFFSGRLVVYKIIGWKYPGNLLFISVEWTLLFNTVQICVEKYIWTLGLWLRYLKQIVIH